MVDAVHAIRESEEFHDFVKALRTHTAHSLRGLATMLENGPRAPGRRARLVGPARAGALIVGWR